MVHSPTRPKNVTSASTSARHSGTREATSGAGGSVEIGPAGPFASPNASRAASPAKNTTATATTETVVVTPVPRTAERMRATAGTSVTESAIA